MHCWMQWPGQAQPSPKPSSHIGQRLLQPGLPPQSKLSCSLIGTVAQQGSPCSPLTRFIPGLGSCVLVGAVTQSGMACLTLAFSAGCSILALPGLPSLVSGWQVLQPNSAQPNPSFGTKVNWWWVLHPNLTCPAP